MDRFISSFPNFILVFILILFHWHNLQHNAEKKQKTKKTDILSLFTNSGENAVFHYKVLHQ